jgi:Domain of unknown function (DUF4386)
MSDAARTTAPRRVPMDSTRKTALVAGIFYVITFVSIPTLAPPLALYSSVTGKDFIISSSTDTGALWGGFLEVIVALAGIGTAITLYPVVKRQNHGMALGFVTARTLEAAMIFTGVASILSLVTLHQDLGTADGADAATLVTVGASHVATYHCAFNAILLGTLLYRSGLVPRALPLIGLIGAPLHLTAVVLTMFGVVDRVGTVTGIAVIPIAVWEFSLGVYLIVKGFKPCPITDAIREDATPPAVRELVT